jgi:hypothetical protein
MGTPSARSRYNHRSATSPVLSPAPWRKAPPVRGRTDPSLLRPHRWQYRGFHLWRRRHRPPPATTPCSRPAAFHSWFGSGSGRVCRRAADASAILRRGTRVYERTRVRAASCTSIRTTAWWAYEQCHGSIRPDGFRRPETIPAVHHEPPHVTA